MINWAAIAMCTLLGPGADLRDQQVMSAMSDPKPVTRDQTDTEAESKEAGRASDKADSIPKNATRLESGASVYRVGGTPEADLETREHANGPFFRAGRVATDTRLPVGYPPPTPPGAIELKHYPTLRRAEFSGNGDSGRMGQRGFWPLFLHITRNDIAMTAPVEMEFEASESPENADEQDTGPDGAQAWTMAFLYHSPDDGPTRNDGPVRVIDTEPATYLSIGVRGRRGWTGIDELVGQLDAWLDSQDEWKRSGAPRTLGYNGPNVRIVDQWWEVQVRVVAAD